MTIELSDEWRSDEPLAYLVKCFDDTMQEYRVFMNESEAVIFAGLQADAADTDWDIFPLYAGCPVEPKE